MKRRGVVAMAILALGIFWSGSASARFDAVQFEKELAFAGKLVAHMRTFATCGLDAERIAATYLRSLTVRRTPPDPVQFGRLFSSLKHIYEGAPPPTLSCAFIVGKLTIEATTPNLVSLQTLLEETAASWRHEEVAGGNPFGLVAEFYLAVVIGGHLNCLKAEAGALAPARKIFESMIDAFEARNLREETKKLLRDVITRTEKIPAECGAGYARSRGETLDLYFKFAADKLGTLP